MDLHPEQLASWMEESKDSRENQPPAATNFGGQMHRGSSSSVRGSSLLVEDLKDCGKSKERSERH